MVELPGHLAMGLLFALPAWILWHDRTSLAFVAFVVGVAVIAGLVVAVFRPLSQRWWRLSERKFARKGTLYLFVAGGFALGGLSHLLADAIAADTFRRIRPLWPIVDDPVAFEIAHFSSPWLNAGLLVVASVLHVLAAGFDAFPVAHRFRLDGGATDRGVRIVDPPVITVRAA